MKHRWYFFFAFEFLGCWLGVAWFREAGREQGGAMPLAVITFWPYVGCVVVLSIILYFMLKSERF